MKRGPRNPFDHVKEIYGQRLEKYSYQELERDPAVSRKVQLENNKNGYGRYENIRGKILEYVLLAFTFFMLAAGIYFILSAIMSA